MKPSHGICGLSVINVYQSNEQTSPIVNQLLYGEHFSVLEYQKFWSKIRLAYDQTEGYILNSLYLPISAEIAAQLGQFEHARYNKHFTSFALLQEQQLLPILIGSRVDVMPILGHQNEEFSANTTTQELLEDTLAETALKYTYAPYMKGGRSPFGIDADGFTQMVYRTAHIQLPRGLKQQATMGSVLSFIEESTPGDLAFFDNAEGELIHVGILLKNNYIIHAHGCVRVDRIDHTGIFNPHTGQYTHKLRVIRTLQTK